MTIQSFMALPAEQRQALAQAVGITNDRLKIAEDVSKKLPYLKVEKAFFKVAGEKYIIPSSLVQLVIKARFIPPGTPASSIPKVNPDDLLDIDAPEGDIQAAKKEPEQHHIPLAYAPYFARDRAPKWHVFLADNRQGKIAVPPFNFDTFDKKPFDESGAPTFNVVTLKMQFGAPPQAGEYKFQMHMVCDSYVGFDHKQEIIMNIDDASRAQEVDDDDDISEPDEDTIAGQLAALKGDATAQDAPKRTKKAKITEEDSDYESGTDDEEGASSGSETDTDTDSEAEEEQAKGKSWW